MPIEAQVSIPKARPTPPRRKPCRAPRSSDIALFALTPSVFCGKPVSPQPFFAGWAGCQSVNHTQGIALMTAHLERINDVFRNVFEDDELTIDRHTTAADVDGWDSLAHVTLLINVEKEFGVKFSSADVARLKSVGDLEDLIDSRMSSV
jgi:acyl carrier protein